jgi:hypothetical protein
MMEFNVFCIAYQHGFSCIIGNNVNGKFYGAHNKNKAMAVMYILLNQSIPLSLSKIDFTKKVYK